MSKSFSVVGAILLSADLKVLLGRRSEIKSEYVGLWQAPGGRIEKDESAEAAAVREVFEETGLAIEQIVPESLWSGEDTFFSLVAMLLFRLPNHATHYRPTQSAEFAEVRWFALDELPPLVPGGPRVFEELRLLLLKS